MAEYQLTATDAVIRTSDSAFIPNDVNNYDRVAYNEWLADGGVPDPYVAPPPPPPVVDANARLDAGIGAVLTTVEDVRDGLHALPLTFNATNFQQFLVHAKTLSDAFVAMLQAQAIPTTPTATPADVLPEPPTPPPAQRQRSKR